MSSEVDISNLALGWLGEDPITSLDDPSRAAQLCKTNFVPLRDSVLEEGEWAFALTQAGPLAPLADPPKFGVGKLFELPEDVVRVLRCDDAQNASISAVVASDRWPSNYSLKWRREGRTIRAETTALYIEYIAKIENTEEFSPGFTMALAARLAAELAMPITKSASMFSNMWKLYAAKVKEGLNLDNMQGRQLIVRSDQLIRVR